MTFESLQISSEIYISKWIPAYLKSLNYSEINKKIINEVGFATNRYTLSVLSFNLKINSIFNLIQIGFLNRLYCIDVYNLNQHMVSF